MKNIITPQLWEFVPSWTIRCFVAIVLTYSFGKKNYTEWFGRKGQYFGRLYCGSLWGKSSCEHVRDFRVVTEVEPFESTNTKGIIQKDKLVTFDLILLLFKVEMTNSLSRNDKV
jgi:hypothetical protein